MMVVAFPQEEYDMNDSMYRVCVHAPDLPHESKMLNFNEKLRLHTLYQQKQV